MKNPTTARSGLVLFAVAAATAGLSVAVLASAGPAESLSGELVSSVQSAADSVAGNLESACDAAGELLRPQFWLSLAGVAQPVGTP